MHEYDGRFRNILDAKGRINLPAHFRDLTSRDQNGDLVFIMTHGSEENIAVFPISEWRRQIGEMEEKITDGRDWRIFIRDMNYNASRQKVDKQGRINIPAGLIEYAHLEKEVDVMGAGNNFEIWNPAKLNSFLEASRSRLDELSDIRRY